MLLNLLLNNLPISLWKRLLIKRLLVKVKNFTFHSALTMKHTNICWGNHFIKNFDLLIIPVATGSLLYLTPS